MRLVQLCQQLPLTAQSWQSGNRWKRGGKVVGRGGWKQKGWDVIIVMTSRKDFQVRRHWMPTFPSCFVTDPPSWLFKPNASEGGRKSLFKPFLMADQAWVGTWVLPGVKWGVLKATFPSTKYIAHPHEIKSETSLELFLGGKALKAPIRMQPC